MGTPNRTNGDALFTALSHPIRRQVLRTMMARRVERSPSELAEELEHSLSKLSYHFGILVDCGAIRLVRTSPARGSTQHFYRPAIDADWARKALRATAPSLTRKKRGEEIA
jgi:DNA-binding transcriptional ArsR family regulator